MDFNFNKKSNFEQIWFDNQQKCYDHYIGQSGQIDYLNEPLHSIFYVAQDVNANGAKQYTAFQSCKKYLRWIKTQKIKNCYEQIRFKHCEYYDLDIKPESPYFKFGSKGILDLFFDLYKKWLSGSHYPHKDIFDVNKHVYILQSTKPEIKISFHIILRHGFVFPNMAQNKLYTDCFFNFIKDESQYSDLIDLKNLDNSVYTKNRCFRTIHCSKFGENRKLKRSNYNDISQSCNEELFSASNIYPELIETHDMCLENEIGYLHICDGLNFINTKEKSKKYDNEFDDDEYKLSPEESKLLFDNLDIKRWDDFTQCRNLIWIGIKINLSKKDIHLYCQKSKKYNKKWVEKLINTYDENSPLKIGTVLYYLKKDVDLITFHKIRPKSLKYDDIMEKPKAEWTKFENNFINEIYLKITNKNIDKLTNPTIIFPSIRVDEFVTSSIYQSSSKKINIVKAGLGKGKSQSVSDFIKSSSKFDSIIVLTPRRSYAKSAKERLKRETGLPFICYSEHKKSNINLPYVVIQAESLYRLDISTESILLIIDEIEAFLYQLTSTVTHKDNHINNVETFIALVKQSQKVIALDAFISDRTLGTFKTLCGIPHIDFFHFTCPLKQRKAVEINDIDTFINCLISDLEQGKKIFLFSSSNSKLLNNKIKKYKPDKDGNVKEDKLIRALIPAIKEKFGEKKKIIEFHSKCMSVELSNVNEDWKDADIVCCTSTITVGCNFDLPNIFHKVYLYANASSRNLVRDMFQATWRIRHLIDEEMVFCLDDNHYGMNLSCSIKEIKNNIENKNELLLKLSASNNITFKKETPDIIKNLVYFNKLESNVSIMSLKPFFNRYLDLCNYKKEEINEDILEVEFEQFIANDDIQYNDIPEITPSQVKSFILKKINHPLLEIESLQLEKFYFQCHLLHKPSNVEEGLWKLYKNFGKTKFKNISIEKGFIEGTCTIKDIIEKESYSHLNSGTTLRIEIIQKICEWVGMKHTSEYGFFISKEKLNNIIKNFEENRQNIHVAFDMRDRTRGPLDSTTTLALMNKVFDRWNYSKILRDKKKKKVKGKVIDNSEYILSEHKNNDINIHINIKPYIKNKNTNKKMHPLLKYKDDSKFISNDELENIRLNI